MAMLAKQCVDHDPILRPDMKQVVISLSQILLSSVEWEATLAGNSQVFSGLVQGRWWDSNYSINPTASAFFFIVFIIMIMCVYSSKDFPLKLVRLWYLFMPTPFSFSLPLFLFNDVFFLRFPVRKFCYNVKKKKKMWLELDNGVAGFNSSKLFSSFTSLPPSILIMQKVASGLLINFFRFFFYWSLLWLSGLLIFTIHIAR